MKGSFFLLVLILAINSLCAQNYQCLQPGSKQYFVNSFHYLRGMRIDSVRTINNNTIFYPFHSRRGYSAEDSNGGSWLGKTVIQSPDGFTRFETMWNDTILIKTQANVGDSWIFFKDTGAVYYVAQLTKIDTASFVGQLDSIKSITISAMKAGVPYPSSPINGYAVILSKNHGFVSIFDLCTFPYTKKGPGNPTGFDFFLSQNAMPGEAAFHQVEYHNPALQSLYDFNPGDIFYSGGELQNPSLSISMIYYAYRDSITSKTISPSGNSYEIQKELYSLTNYSYNNPSTYKTDRWTTTLVVPNGIKMVVDTVSMPEEAGNQFLYYYNPADTSHCFISPYYRRAHFYYRTPLDAPGNESEGYKVGFGLTDSTYGYIWDTYNYLQAYYFMSMSATQKGGVPCGKIAPSSVSSPLDQRSGYEISPVPADQIIKITSIGTVPLKSHFLINDVAGRTIYSNQNPSAITLLDTRSWPQGLYILSIRNGEKNEIHKLSIVH